MRDSALTVTFSYDPRIAPEGELRCDASVADIMIRHGADMLTTAGDNGTLLCMPAAPDAFTPDAAAEPGWSASSDAAPSVPASRHSRDEASMHLDSDVCLSINVLHWIDVAGNSGASGPARAQVHLQVRSLTQQTDVPVHSVL